MSHWKPSAWNPLQRGHPLCNGLVGAWLMNEGGGDLTMESVSGAFPTAHTAPWAFGQGNHGAEIGPFGASAVLTFAHNPLWDLPYPFTVSVILRYTGTSNEVVFEKNGNNGFSVQTGTGGKVHMITGSGFSPLCETDAVNDGLPHMATFVAESSGDAGMSAYRDGVFIELGKSVTPSYGSSTVLYIGHRAAAAPFTLGNVIAAFIWDRALNADQIRAHYQDPYAIWRRPPLLMKPGAAPPASSVPAIAYNYRRRRAG